MQQVIEGADIAEFDVLNMDMDNDGIPDRYDNDFRDSDYFESTYDVDDNLHQKEETRSNNVADKKPSTLEMLNRFKEEVRKDNTEVDKNTNKLER